VKYRFMNEHRRDHAITLMCRVLRVARALCADGAGPEARPNARWSLDFVHDQMADGRRFRIQNIVDDVTHECLASIPDTSISGHRVVRVHPAWLRSRIIVLWLFGYADDIRTR
jgi:hypothetical protein